VDDLTSGRVEIRWDPDDWVEVRDRWFPRTFSMVYRPRSDELTPSWRVVWEVRDGRPQCRQAVFEASETGREIRSVDLRRLSLEDLVEAAATNMAAKRATDEDGRVHMVRDLRDWQATIQQVRKARGDGRRSITAEKLARVAKVYRANVDSTPVRAVRDELGLGSERTARRWIQLARDRGFLGEAIPGKAGER
jgi:hypothetical protein